MYRRGPRLPIRPKVVGQEGLPSRSNSVTTRNPWAWQTDMPQPVQLAFRGLYPGIDALFPGNSQRQREAVPSSVPPRRNLA